MDQEAVSTLPDTRAARPARPRSLKRLWKRLRGPLARSRAAQAALVFLFAGAIRLVYRTNRPAAGSDDIDGAVAAHSPAIAAFWHGQHLMAPAVNPRGNRMVALFSRSADAEINARVAERLGLGVVRGSGGREGVQNAEKGGARALIALKKTLDAGTNVAMIADIPHGTPREAGLGIVTLARVSGRPIVPVAIATSRRKVLERTWDKTTINLPFGRRAIAIGEAIHVPADATPAELEEKRRAVTAALDAVTRRAYGLADGEAS
jgi:lysophospholipid acyltransferase (LPLAT)-like uncharacterized protein